MRTRVSRGLSDADVKCCLRKRAAPNLFRLYDARAGYPFAVWRDARMHQVSCIVRELSRRTTSAGDREKLQLVAGKSAIDDGLSVGRPVHAVIRRTMVVEQLFPMRAVGVDDP